MEPAAPASLLYLSARVSAHPEGSKAHARAPTSRPAARHVSCEASAKLRAAVKDLPDLDRLDETRRARLAVAHLCRAGGAARSCSLHRIQAAAVSRDGKVAWVIDTFVPCGSIKTSTRASSCLASASIIVVPRPRFLSS